MKILHVSPTFYPATFWGGPIWSTKAICDGIAGLPDTTLRVLTTDAASPAKGHTVTPEMLPYDVTYAPRIAGHSISPTMLQQLPAAIRWADVVHLTGVYNAPTLPVFAIMRALGKPLIWSPRGALQATQEWPDAPKRRAKQRFETVLNLLRPRPMVMHVTAAAEAAASLQRFAGLDAQIIPNAVDLPHLAAPSRAARRGTNLIYLGRLHPKKGLEVLLDAMHRLPAHFSLDIYGAGDADYTARLHQLASDLGRRIRFHGNVIDEDKAAAFAQADLFVLPSYSENFGIAVAEALAHGLPVLTTTATPWQALDARGCGRCITIGHDELAAEIRDLALQDLVAMGARGRAWVQKDFATSTMVDAFAKLYHDLAACNEMRVFA
jgi:glycosyltransferase involved in cell wall biosynthesis